MAKLILHIGLPKTGTTTLQKNYFTESQKNNYHGVFQPRHQPKLLNTKLYKSLFQVSMGNNVNQDIIDTFMHNDAKNAIISEEMFTVSTKVDWITKLQNLSRALKNHDDYKIVVSLRDPLKASFSYYVERYEVISQNGKIDFPTSLKNSLHLKVYHYDLLMPILESLFHKDKIDLFFFEDVFIGGDYSRIESIFGESVLGKFPTDNKTKSDKNFTFSNKGTKVIIPSHEDFHTSTKLLNYDYWESLKDKYKN